MILSDDYLVSFRTVFEACLRGSGEPFACNPDTVNVAFIKSKHGDDVLITVSGDRPAIEKLFQKKRIYYYTAIPAQTDDTEPRILPEPKAKFFIGLQSDKGLGNLKLLHPLLTTWANPEEGKPLILQDIDVLKAIAHIWKTKKVTQSTKLLS